MAIVCQCPNKCEIHPKYDKPLAVMPKHEEVAPEIDAMDRLQLKTLEAESLKAQIEAERARQQHMLRTQQAFSQLEQFTAAMYDKHGLKQSEWSLDLNKLEFVRRPESQ